MSWSKLKQQLESFLCPALHGIVEYRATGYRYLPDKPGICYIAVDKKNVLNMNDPSRPITWYRTDQDVRHDPDIQVPVSPEEIETLRAETKGSIPEDRLEVIIRGRKSSELAKQLILAQSALSKSNFTVAATRFLAASIEESLESNDIMLNILALLDRRVGKKRLLNMAAAMKTKHPAVQYFYALRRRV